MVKEKQITLKTIAELDYKLTPAELATHSGLSLNQASFWLNRVAGETNGNLQITADGGIIYEFKKNFKDAYLQHGIEKFLRQIGVFLFNLLYWIIRVSFGVILLLSILLIIALITAIIAAACAAAGDSNHDGNCGDCDISGFFDLNFLGDLFTWSYSPSSTYYPNSLPSERRKEYEKFNRTHKRGNFFLECFSFLFGDGAPNSNLQEVRWQQIARVITENGGVVSTEQLAPFLDGDSSDSGMILNALAQLNGHPEVTKSGFIVYIFPDFLEAENAPTLPSMRNHPYLMEDSWKFSAYDASTWGPVLFLALLNFAGSWWLFKHIATIALLTPFAALIDVFLGYAIIFLAIPLIRWFVLLILNARIADRNQRRQKAFELINRPQGDILKEINEAKEIREQELEKSLTDKRVIYTTENDLLEQQFDSDNKPKNT